MVKFIYSYLKLFRYQLLIHRGREGGRQKERERELEGERQTEQEREREGERER